MKSMVTVQIQPHYSEWTESWLVRSIRKELNEFFWRINNLRWADGLPGIRMGDYEHPQIKEWLENQYVEARGSGRLRMDYQQFLFRVTGPYSNDPIYRRWHAGLKGPYREGKAYRKNPDHKPKTPIDDAWHQETGHKRDKARHGGGCMRHSCRRRRFWVKKAARQHRAWIKQKLHNEDWEAFDNIGDSEYQQFADPWKWD